MMLLWLILACTEAPPERRWTTCTLSGQVVFEGLAVRTTIYPLAHGIVGVRPDEDWRTESEFPAGTICSVRPEAP